MVVLYMHVRINRAVLSALSKAFLVISCVLYRFV